MSPQLEIIIAAIIWGSGGAFVKWLNLPPTTVTFFRAIIPTILVGLYLVSIKANFKSYYRKELLLPSLLNSIRTLFFFIGYTLTSIGNAVIILYTAPMITTALEAFFIKEKITRRQLILVCLAFIGILLVYASKPISFGSRDFLGMSAMLLCAVLSASMNLIHKHQIHNYSRWEVIFFHNVVGAVLFLPFLFINQPFPTSTQFLIGSTYAFLIGVIAFALYFSALKHMKASAASTISYLEVVSAILFGIVFFGEEITAPMLVGGSLIIFSSLLTKK